MSHYEEQYAKFGALCDDLNKAVDNNDPKKFAEAEEKMTKLPNTGHVDVTEDDVTETAARISLNDESTYDRFNLEDKIQNVWATSEDLDSILFRVSDDPNGPPSEDQLINLLIGLKEMHDSRCRELMYVFETMIHDNCFGDKDKGVPCPLRENATI
jgi:hypothetical protein